MNWQKEFPPSKGWIRAELTMKSAQMADVESIKRTIAMLSGESVDVVKFGSIKQHGRKVTVIYLSPGHEKVCAKRAESEVRP